MSMVRQRCSMAAAGRSTKNAAQFGPSMRLFLGTGTDPLCAIGPSGAPIRFDASVTRRMRSFSATSTVLLLTVVPVYATNVTIIMQQYFFNGTGELRSNPERGFRHELHPDANGTISTSSLDQLRMYNLTVAQTYFYLPDAPVLSRATIEGVGYTLRTLRQRGVKALWRFAYDRCPGGYAGGVTHTCICHILN